MKKMMLFYVLLLMGSFALQPVLAQSENSKKIEHKKIVKVDYEQCMKFGQNKKAFNLLKKRFLKNDTTLTIEEGVKLYFGYPYTKAYKWGATPTKADKAFEQGDYAKAYKWYKKFLKKNPFSLAYLRKALVSAERANIDISIIKNISNRYALMLKTVFHTGTGESFEKAFKVVNVADEYIIMNLYPVEGFKGQMLAKGYYDVLTFIDAITHKERSLYFDMRIHKEQMMKALTF
jgi:tetratricopeptide (TPR) repeat protein